MVNENLFSKSITINIEYPQILFAFIDVKMVVASQFLVSFYITLPKFLQISKVNKC